jgi:sulfonate transport system ATP-binding protein
VGPNQTVTTAHPRPHRWGHDQPSTRGQTRLSQPIGRGEIVALIGRSGSGKSTVLRVLAGLSSDHTGDRLVSAAPALAFQEPRLFPWRDVRTNVIYGLNRRRLARNATKARAERALADVGLADRASAWPSTLSGPFDVADRVDGGVAP